MHKDLSPQLVGQPRQVRAWLDQAFRDCPALFPAAFAGGYTLKDHRRSAMTGLCLRRVRLQATGQAFSLRPSFGFPSMPARTDEVQSPLFLRAFGGPFWALARVFGRDPNHWYRLEVSRGRNRIVGTTVRKATLPEHLLADEHHQSRDGLKNDIATTVGAGCCRGAALAQTAGVQDLQGPTGVSSRRPKTSSPTISPGRSAWTAGPRRRRRGCRCSPWWGGCVASCMAG